MRIPSNKNWISFARALLAGSIFGLIVHLWWLHVSDDVLLRNLAADESTSAEYEILSSENSTDQETILVDSILSIIQNYYVDSDRVSNKDILMRTFANLSLHPKIQHEERNNKHFISINGKVLSLKLPERPSYVDTVRALVELSKHIDANLDHTKNDGSSKWYARGDVMVLNALLTALDAHSLLMSSDAYQELRQGTDGAFGGLGVVVGMRHDILTVLKPLPRSPASRVGIQKNDKIVAIDGVHTYGSALDDLVDSMRGSPGTKVRVGLLRDGDPFPRLLSLEREMITVDSVSSKTVRHGKLEFLVLKVESFSSRTADEIRDAIQNFRDQHLGKCDGLILDLRGNPGGLLDQAVEVANLFIDSGTIVSTKGRTRELEVAHDGAKQLDFPMAVLIDEESASASEIVAGALQDHSRAVTIGQPSFGKGSVQTIFELPGQSALKLTIARYYTPSGRSIQNVGITPELWLQPILRGEQNSNLLGNYRYRNERFLRNHLEASATDSSLSLAAKTNLKSLKFYYLTDKDRQDLDEFPANDLALKAAQLVLAAIPDVMVSAKNRDKSSVMFTRTLFDKTADIVSERMRDVSEETRRWLSDKHQIRWSSKADIGSEFDSLKLQILHSENLSAPQGGKMEIVWKIQNDGSTDAERVSLFVSPVADNFESGEVLVGEILAGETRRGVMHVNIPPQVPSGSMKIRVGCAIDAQPLSNTTKEVAVAIRARDLAILSPVVSLDDAGAGHVAGLLEPHENARIRIALTNKGLVAAHNVTVSLVNLAGSQWSIPVHPFEFGELAPSETKVIFAPVVGGNEIYADKLFFGFNANGEDVLNPVRQSMVVGGEPNVQKINVSKGEIFGTMSH